MSVNLAKYKEPLLAAWKDVLDDKTQTDWALFGYEGQTNDLKVVSKGSGGIEELVDDLNSGKIMYAFCKVTDPKTSLPKNVLINWQGEGAPVVRKGTCANHIRDIGNFFKGAHVTLHARNEEEVDTQIIIDKVSKSGSAYKFNERVESETGAGPVGTTYKRVIPKQEIDSKERDKFWEKEEQEEKQRQIEEQKRRIAESSKLDDERKQRELNEAAMREAKIQVRSQTISQQREAEKQANVQKADVSVDESTGDDERKGRSDVLRRQRSQEAQSVISKRNFDARAVFEQNTSAGQLHQLRRTSLNQPTATAAQTAPLSPGKKASWPPASADPPSPSNEVARPAVEASYSSVGKSVTYPGNGTSSPTHASSPANASSPTSRNAADFDRSPSVPVAEVVKNGGSVKKVAFEESVAEDRYEPVAFVGATKAVPFIPEPEREWQAGVDDDGLDYNGLDLNEPGLQARALYDYQAADATELTFDPGDVITHIDQIDEGWWQGLGPDGTFGLFPANYVELIE